jgi:hypothetical protein
MDDDEVLDAEVELARLAERSIAVAWEAAAEEELRQRFIEDYLDASLWPDHRKTLKLPRYPHYRHGGGGVVDRLAAHLVERGQVIDGLTVAEMAERSGLDLNVPKDLANLRVALGPEPEEEEEEDEDP